MLDGMALSGAPMSKNSSMHDDQLARKLQLWLGSKIDWMPIYADWCADNDVGSEGQQYDDHNVNLFVRQQRARVAA